MAPCGHLPARLADRPQADLLDQADFLGQRNEFRRRDFAKLGVVPARQRFDAIEGAVDGSGLRLIVQLQPVIGDGLAQRRAEDEPLLGKPVHVGTEEAVGGAAGLLGLVHRRIGLLHQRIVIGRIVGVDADAHADGNRHLPVVDPQRRRQRFGDVGGDQRGARRIAVRQHDDELVAAQSPQQVGRLDAGAQPFGKLDQQRVARRMSQRVVDVLEVIEVEEYQGELFFRGNPQWPG